ncbi:unnamed protein product, partial [marine sediment metagenome]
WINKAEPAVHTYLICKSGYNDYKIGMGSTGSEIVFTLHHGGAITDMYGKTPVTDNNWHLVVSTYDGSEMKLFIDGVLDVSTPAAGPIHTSDRPVVINQWYPGLGISETSLDEVRIYDRALTEEEIERLYESPVPSEATPFHTTEWRDLGREVDLSSLEAKTYIPGNSGITATIEVSDDGENVLGSVGISLEDGSKSYDISGLESARYARIRTEFTGPAMLDKYVLTGDGIREVWGTLPEWERGIRNLVTPIYTGIPKLAYENLQVSKTEVDAGEYFELSAMVTNEGSGGSLEV